MKTQTPTKKVKIVGADKALAKVEAQKKEKASILRKCAMCDKDISSPHSTQKYCTECQGIKKRFRARTSQKQRMKNRKAELYKLRALKERMYNLKSIKDVQKFLEECGFA